MRPASDVNADLQQHALQLAQLRLNFLRNERGLMEKLESLLAEQADAQKSAEEAKPEKLHARLVEIEKAMASKTAAEGASGK